jgi:hypothetical protein
MDDGVDARQLGDDVRVLDVDRAPGNTSNGRLVGVEPDNPRCRVASQERRERGEA